MAKIYRVSVVVKNEHTTYIEAESQEEAAEKAQRLYSEDGPIEYEWGAEELSSEIYADDEPLGPAMLQPDYRGDAVKIAKENEEAFKQLEECTLVYCEGGDHTTCHW